MKLETFLALYKTKKKPESQKDLITEKIIVNKYVPVEEKKARIENLIKATYYTGEGKDRTIHVDSIAKHVFTMITLIDLYTTIDVDYKNALEIYNSLKECGALDQIVPAMDTVELQEFKFLLDAACSDVMINEYEIHSYITKQVNHFSELFEKVVTPFLDKINSEDVMEVLSKVKMKE